MIAFVLTSRLLQRILMVALMALTAMIVVVLVRGGAAGSSAGPAPASAHSQFDGPTLPPHLTAASFSLIDQDGHRVTLAQYRGRVVVLTFIHSRCHDMCPFMVEQIKGALGQLSGRSDAGLPAPPGSIPVIGISVAPAEDTTGSRRRFLRQHQMLGRLAFVNGPLSVMRRVWHAYAMQPVAGRVDHSTFVLLIDKRGTERVGFPAGGLTPEGLDNDIRVLQRERG